MSAAPLFGPEEMKKKKRMEVYCPYEWGEYAQHPIFDRFASFS